MVLLRFALGMISSGSVMDAGWVPGRRPRDMDASCSLMARSRSRIYLSICGDGKGHCWNAGTWRDSGARGDCAY